MKLVALFILAAAVGADAPKTKSSKSKTTSSAQQQRPSTHQSSTSKKSSKKSESAGTARRRAKRPLSKQAKNDYLRAQSQMKIGSLSPIKLTPRRPYYNSKTYMNLRGNNVTVWARDPYWGGARWDFKEALRADERGNATNFVELRFRAEAARAYLIDCTVYYGSGQPEIQVMTDPCTVRECRLDASQESGTATLDGQHLLRYLPPKSKQREVTARVASTNQNGMSFYGCEITPLESAN